MVRQYTVSIRRLVRIYIHGRSGRVALPRTKLVLAIAAAFLGAPARRAERAAVLVRKSAADMLMDFNSRNVDTASMMLLKM